MTAMFFSIAWYQERHKMRLLSCCDGCLARTGLVQTKVDIHVFTHDIGYIEVVYNFVKTLNIDVTSITIFTSIFSVIFITVSLQLVK